MWLASQSLKGLEMAKALRPDRDGVVIEFNQAGNLVAHCARPAAWRRKPLIDWLVGMATRTHVIIEPDSESVLLLSHDGTTKPLEFMRVNLETNNREYRIEAPE